MQKTVAFVCGGLASWILGYRLGMHTKLNFHDFLLIIVFILSFCILIQGEKNQ